jgi:pimeloyl-ACP methyl ester carboxylesterase
MYVHDGLLRFAGLAGDSLGEDDQRSPLVLLHGLTYDRRLWGPALRELRTLDPGRRVLNLDLPGHGESIRRDSYAMEELAPLIREAVEAAGLRSPVLVGHSAGAVLATIYASRYPTSGVVNVDQPLLTTQFAQLLRAHEATLRGPGFTTLWDMMVASMHAELLPPDAQQLLRTITDPRQDLLIGYWEDVLTASPADLADRIAAGLAALRRTGVPYLTVFGQTPSAEYQTWLADMLPDAVSTVLPDSGHFPQLAHPTRFARVLASTARWPE